MCFLFDTGNIILMRDVGEGEGSRARTAKKEFLRK